MKISDFAVPVVFITIIIYGLAKRLDIFSEFTEGVKEGLKTVLDIFPALFALVLSVGMFRASGGLQLISELLSPITGFFGFPKEVTPLFVMRPFSGSGAVAIYENILRENGADSLSGRVASVILGSSETTFYTIAVYFAATKVKKMRYTLAAAFSGDITAWLLSGVVVLWFFR